jgi:hypothetical protein
MQSYSNVGVLFKIWCNPILLREYITIFDAILFNLEVCDNIRCNPILIENSVQDPATVGDPVRGAILFYLESML